jgi:hypothetical protein
MILKRAPLFIESPTTRGAGGWDFFAIGGKKQRRDSALIGAGVTGSKASVTPNYAVFRKLSNSLRASCCIYAYNA